MTRLELDERIVAQLQERVASGEYSDVSAVVRGGLRWIKPRVEPLDIDRLLQEAREDYDRDGYEQGSPELMDESEQEAEERMTRRVSVELEVDVVERIEALLGDPTGDSDFADESAVVSKALFLLEDRKKLLHLRKLLAEAEDDFEHGRFVRWKPGMMQELLELGRQRMRDGISPSPDVI